MEVNDRVKVIEISRFDAWYKSRKEYIGKVGIITTFGIVCGIKFDYNGEDRTFLPDIKLEKINGDEIIYDT